MNERSNPWQSGRFLQAGGRDPKVLFAHLHEDPEIERRLLALLPDAAKVVCVAGSGCQAFSLLEAGAARVIATDVNPAQIALVCLKLAVIRQVPSQQAARWMIADARGALNEPAVRESLSPEVVGYWQKHRATLSRGLCFCGVIERRLRWLNRVARPLILRTGAVNALLRMDSPEQQADWFAKHWKGWRWSAAWNGLRLLGNLGYHQSFRRELPEDAIRRLQQTFESVLTSRPVRRNPWLQATLTGSFGEHPPSFFTESGMERIRARLGDLELRVGDLESLLNEQEPNSCHLVSLSNIADTMTLDQLAGLLRAIVSPLAPDGLVVLRSMIRDSSAVAQVDGFSLRFDESLTAELRFQDRSPLCPVVAVWRASTGRAKYARGDSVSSSTDGGS